MYGSDQVASIESVNELMVSVRKIEKMLGDGKKVVYDSEVPIAEKVKKGRKHRMKVVTFFARGESVIL